MSAKNIPFGQPILGDEEKQAVADVLSGPILVHGPKSELFESSFAEFTGAPHAISVSSCTAGMHLIYHALGFGPGDEVKEGVEEEEEEEEKEETEDEEEEPVEQR